MSNTPPVMGLDENTNRKCGMKACASAPPHFCRIAASHANETELVGEKYAYGF